MVKLLSCIQVLDLQSLPCKVDVYMVRLECELCLQLGTALSLTRSRGLFLEKRDQHLALGF